MQSAFRSLAFLGLAACAACGGGGGGDSTTTPPVNTATAPAITTQPADQTVNAGASAKFTVAASGTAPLSYQWKRAGTDISGATSASYTTAALTTADSGASFTVVVSNSAGNATSRSALLAVNAVVPPPMAPAISTQPIAASVVAGATATFSVTATGTAPLTYQWKVGGTAIAGATASSYTIPATQSADNGKSFSVVITNAAGTVTSNAAVLTVTAAASTPSITTQPAAVAVTAGSAATFKVVANGGSLTYQWKRDGTAVIGATSATYTVPATEPGDSGALFSVDVSNSIGSIPSATAQLTVDAVTPANGIDIVTFKYDSSRSGANVNESLLTTANVKQATFGLLHNFATDGKVDAQPLYLAQVSIAGTAHNVLFIATEHGTVYAIDADTYAVLWQVSLVPAGQSTSDDMGCTQVTPEIGITSTPVIDRHAGTHGTLYVVAMSKDSSSYHHRLHALDITTGADTVTPKEITASFTDVNGQVTTFAPAQYEERTALLLSNSTVYTAWTSHCDDPPYGGWIVTYDQTSLAQTGVLNAGPSSAGLTGNTSSTVGPGIWMSGSGPAVDAGGNVYLLTGNGPFDTTLDAHGRPVNGNYSQSFLKMRTDASGLSVVDYFALRDGLTKSQTDLDLGGGGGLMLPQMTDSHNNPVNLYVGAGKDGNVYIVDQTNLGGFNAASNDIWQEIDGAVASAVRASPAYFNNHLFYGPRDTGLKSFSFNQALMSTVPTSTSTAVFGYPGTSPTVSANGTANGIVWAHETNGSGARLHAYDATDLTTELYNSTQAGGGRDSFGAANKFIVPVVSAGKVFVGTNAGVAIFGIL